MDRNFIPEYEQSFENWRFLVGLRFTVLAFFLTLTSALIYTVLTQTLFKEQLYQYLISIIGIASSWSIIMFEGRNRQLYYTCIKRAKEIENYYNRTEENQGKGLANDLDTVPPKFWAWHTLGFYMFYGITLIIWIALFIATIFNKFPAIP